MIQDQKVQLQFAEHAGRLNDGLPGSHAGESLNLLAQAGWLGLGVPESLGGGGGRLLDVVEAIAAVSEQCLTSGFVFWCQRAFIEYLAASDNRWLQAEILPQALKAELSGATGLSNAMKHLAGIEQLRLEARLDAETVTLNGFLPWASNLRPKQFAVAIAAQTSSGRSLVVAVPASAQGLKRGEDLQLLGLQASWTSTLSLEQVKLSHTWIISDAAQTFLAKIRPAFVLMQCGLALGIARRSLNETLQSINGGNEQALINHLRHNTVTLAQLEAQVWQLGIVSTFTLAQVRQLFELRIALTRLALDTVWLELEAKGGSAYFKPSGTARRLREVAFLPVLTPSLVQLETELQRHRAMEQVA
ncbi:acyl-CoA/acyl-ACP dehydrogenase (plasmid) [Kovacikia minuta CCNUW1]|uniref:acyl-CoA dehydrogenase family protein n=1 Tax=Kovacikia minuta TaxID=2931930 RepID=UPI001CCE2C5F|nr:acyl-CoA dehydrogenase family protein [Kovacikia minuta]UBF30604.1 acyl-CoA/acyl-ACP dehydrogenase [Kovacikia minuta CCNUW1]